MIDNVFLDGAEYHATLGVSGTRPGYLGCFRLGAEFFDLGFGHGRCGSEMLEGGGVPALDLVRFGGDEELRIRHWFVGDAIV